MAHWQPALIAGLVCACVAALGGAADGDGTAAMQIESARRAPGLPVQLGPRPYYLVDRMRDGLLRQALADCAARKRRFSAADFSIGHRGAPLQFPEHTRESYLAAARMGAGIIECDVTFTADRQLVCRHAQCDLHATTDIVASPLAKKCSVPPAIDATGRLINAEDIRCCTSDISLAEFKTLRGKMDGADTNATTIAGYLAGTPDFRTELYAGDGRGTLMSHAASIELFKKLGVGMAPELKAPQVPLPHDGDYTQRDYARQMIEEYRAAGVSPARVWPQSFNYDDVLYWLKSAPDYAQQAVFLDSRYKTDVNDPAAVAALEPSMAQLARDGVNILAPPISMLLTTQGERIVPSHYAAAAREAGLDIIAWTTERSGPLARSSDDFYYASVSDLIESDGDIFTVIDALARDVGVIGLFSDWPATTTFYANCMNIAAPRDD